MHTPGHDPDHDPWAAYRAGREAWREQRRARREAWRESWRARREERRERWHQLSMGYAGWGRGDWNTGPSASGETEAMKAKVADMQKTINELLQRVAVLEKLATDDDAKLAREIERLRGTDPRS